MSEGFCTSLPFTWQWPNCDFQWRGLNPQTHAAAQFLAQQQLARGARLGICAENSLELAAIIQAAALMGYCIVLFNPRLEDARLKHLSETCTLDLLISNTVSELSINCVALPPLATDAAFAFSSEDCLRLEDPCVVIMSSGSQGNEKFIRLSLRAVLHASANAIDALSMSDQDNWLACLPFYHVGGLSIVYRSAMVGSNFYVSAQFNAVKINTIIDQSHISGISVVPTMLHRLIKRTTHWPAHLRCILLGGAAANSIDCQVSEEKGLRPIHSYGMSETCGFIAVQQQTQAGEHHCGCLTQNMKVQSDDAFMLSVKGPQLFSAYEQNGSIVESQHQDTWFETQDLGYLDEYGNLHINGRRDDVFIRGGENISLHDAETCVSHLHLCDESAMAIIADKEWGQVPVLIYVGSISEAELLSRTELLMPALLSPVSCKSVEAIPLLANGKVDRQSIAKLFMR